MISQHFVTSCVDVSRSNTYVMMDLLYVLLDGSIKQLDHTAGDINSWLRPEESAALFSRLEQCGATGLHELTVKVEQHKLVRLFQVRLDPRTFGGSRKSETYANLYFHRVLRNGLASHLRSLVLHSVCDNAILGLLGKQCPHLRHLDATSSWLVDDGGIIQLCFRDPELHLNSSYSHYGNSNDYFARQFLSVSDIELTSCCRTLHEVRIQDTNTSEVGVLLLLLFLPNLRSLGGFIYYRNVGDAVVSLYRSKAGLQLSLTDLWDTCLSQEKAQLVSEAAPLLSSLYTRGTCLENVGVFTNLTSVTVDFDFIDCARALEQYLFQHGKRLRKLVLVDQMHSVDITMLAELCPDLEELGAKVEGAWWGEPGTMLTNLNTCRVRVGCTETLRALLVHSPNLAHLEVILEEERYSEGVDVFDDSLVSYTVAENPCLAKLRVFMMRSECNLTVLTVHLLINACPALKFVGELQMWAGVAERDVEELAADIRDRNLDLLVSYRGLLYPLRKTNCVTSLYIYTSVCQTVVFILPIIIIIIINCFQPVTRGSQTHRLRATYLTGPLVLLPVQATEAAGGALKRYKADKTGHFFNCLPNQTLVLKGETCHGGGERRRNKRAADCSDKRVFIKLFRQRFDSLWDSLGRVGGIITLSWSEARPSAERHTMYLRCALLRHVAALYLLAVTCVAADVLVYRLDFHIEVESEFRDLQARFGDSLPLDGLKGLVVYAQPPTACKPIEPPPNLSVPDFPDQWVVLIKRFGGCTFEDKVRHAQAANYSAAIIHNVNSSDLEPMSAKNSTGIRIPSVFVGEQAGVIIRDHYQWRDGYYVVINDDMPFNINTHLLLPFAIVVGISFLVGVIFTCIDPWLTKNRRVCPVCKRKVFAHDERVSDSGSDTETDDTTPLVRGETVTQQGGGTFAPQRENPFVRAGRENRAGSISSQSSNNSGWGGGVADANEAKFREILRTLKDTLSTASSTSSSSQYRTPADHQGAPMRTDFEEDTLNFNFVSSGEHSINTTELDQSGSRVALLGSHEGAEEEEGQDAAATALDVPVTTTPDDSKGRKLDLVV
uniref:PA domain-containing protein n=1 Tax=Timema douglasi TaxID=61478 RepID=A0A7R8VR45_TIMDO|nr:unnamed protein product [Timema douglasi]